MADEMQNLEAQTTESAEEEDLEAQLAYENLKRKREAKKRKRIIAIAVVAIIALIGIVVYITGQSGKEAAENDPMAQMVTGMAYEGTFTTTVTANGATEPVTSTVVTPEVDGIIENLRVQEGSVVNEGDELFTLKNEELDKSVREATSELDAAQRAVEKAENAVDRANQEVDDAYAAYNKKVDEVNAAAAEGQEVVFDEATEKATLTAADKELENARDDLTDKIAAYDAAVTKLDETKAKADKRVVRAPVSGTIVSMTAQDGAAYGSVTSASSNAGASTGSGPLIQISDLSKMKVTVQVNEIDISSISAGQQAKATFSAIPGLELGAVVERIASASTGSASSEGGPGGVVNYAVDLIIPEPDSKLKPGMTATVTITTQSVPDCLIVPSSALNELPQADGTVAYSVVVAEEGEDGAQTSTRDVPVEVLAQNTSEAAVKGDLKDGDLVVIGGGSADLEALAAAAGEGAAV